MDFDLTKAVLPEGTLPDFDVSRAVTPQAPDTFDVVKAILPTAYGMAQTGVGGLTRAAGDVVKGVTGYGGLSEVGRGIGESGQINVDLATPKNMTFGQEALLTGGTSAALAIPTALAYPLTGVAGVLTAMGSLTGGQTYQQAREFGLNPARSLTHSVFEGGVEALTELLPAKALFGASKNLLSRFVNFMSKEVPGELVATALQDASAKLGYKPDMTVDEFFHDMLLTVAATGVAGPIQVGAMHGIGRLADAVTPAPLAPVPSPGIPPANSQAVVPPPPAAPDAFDMLSAASKTVAPADIESMRSFVQQNPPTAEQVQQAEVVDEQLKSIRKQGQETGQDPDLASSDGVARHMRDKYSAPNPASTTPPEEHPVLFGPPDVAGKPLGNTAITPGTVITTGFPDEKFPLPYLQKVHDTMQEWVTRFAPSAKVVITTRDKFNENVVAQTVFKDGHAFVIPRHFYQSMLDRMQPSEQYPEGIQEPTAQTSALYSLSHEFGRILTETTFREATPEVQQRMQADWQAARSRVETGEMTAQEFLQTWLSPWKIGAGIRTGQNDTFIRKVMFGDQSQRDVSKTSAKDLVRAIADKGDGNVEQVLSFQSWMAEQTTRYMHQRQITDKSPLGQFFSRVVEKLREFFNFLSSSGQLQFADPIAATKGFTQWLDGLTESQTVAPTVLKKDAEAKTKRGAKKKKAVTPVEPVEPTLTDPTAETKRLRGLAIKLKKDAPEEYGRIMQLIKDGDFTGAQEALVPFFDDDGTPKFDVGELVENDVAKKGFQPIERIGLTDAEAKNPVNLAYAHKLAKDMGGVEFTPMFKTWAGDWELFGLWQQRQALRQQLDAVKGNDKDTVAITDRLESVTRDIKALKRRYEGHIDAGPEVFRKLFQSVITGVDTVLNLDSRPIVTAVLDGSGKPRRVFHGSATGDEEFDPNFSGITKFNLDARGVNTGASSAEQGFFASGTVQTAEAYSYGFSMVPVFDSNTDQSKHNSLQEKISKLEFTHRSLQGEITRLSGKLYGMGDPTEIGDRIVSLQTRAQAILDGIHDLEDEQKHYVRYEPRPPVVYPIYLAMMNPYEFDYKGAVYVVDHTDYGESEETGEQMPGYSELILRAKEGGHDGVIIYNTLDGGPLDTVYVFFHPQQVKAALGSVTFAKTDELHFDLGSETESAANNDNTRIPAEAEVGTLELGEGMRNLSRWQLSTLQLQQLAHLNPGVSGLDYFNRINLAYEQLRKSLMARGQEVAKAWQFLMKESRSYLDRALTAEYHDEKHWSTLTRDPAGHWIHEPSEYLLARVGQLGVNVNSEQGKMVVQTMLDTKNVHLAQLQALEKVLYDRLTNRYKDPTVLAVKAAQLFKTVEDIRNTPFLPQSRFGKYSIVVSETQPKGPPTPVHVEYFESKQQRNKAFLAARKSELARGSRRVTAHDLSDAVSVMPSIPQTYIDTVADMLGLSDEDVMAMQMAAQAVKAKAVFGKYDKEFRRITGASKDLQRNFADHVWHNANLIAKLKYRPEFTRAVTMVSRQIRDLHVENGYTPPLQNLQRWMTIQRDYILNPQAELQKVRSIVTLLALWGNVKTAAMNMTSIVNTWTVLVDKFGYKNASEEILRALKDEANAMHKTTQFSSADRELRSRLNIEGVTDQSYAYMLAEMSNSSALRRAFKQTRAGQAWESLLQVGMLPFRIVEIYSRRAGALAAARLMVKEGASVEAAHDYASKTVLLTQNDFSPGNRPRFMQGKQSLALIFFSFVQMMMFVMGGGVGAAAAARLWVFYGLLGGMLGLPGMENLMDALKIVWKKVLGQDQDPKKEMYGFLQEVTGGNARWLMNGLFHNLGGFDLSRSVSLGRIIPGTDVLAGEGDLAFKTENMAADLTGPLGGTVHGLLQFLTSTDSNFIKRAGSAMPGTMRNLLQAYLYATDGVRGASGAPITRDRDGTLRDLTGLEVLGKALGFQPAIVSENREVDREQREMRDYWMHKRSGLLRHMWEAELQHDREAIADVKGLVRSYNESAPSTSLRITERDLHQSHVTRQHLLERDQAGLAPNKRYDPLYQEIELALRGGL